MIDIWQYIQKPDIFGLSREFASKLFPKYHNFSSGDNLSTMELFLFCTYWDKLKLTELTVEEIGYECPSIQSVKNELSCCSSEPNHITILKTSESVLKNLLASENKDIGIAKLSYLPQETMAFNCKNERVIVFGDKERNWYVVLYAPLYPLDSKELGRYLLLLSVMPLLLSFIETPENLYKDDLSKKMIEACADANSQQFVDTLLLLCEQKKINEQFLDVGIKDFEENVITRAVSNIQDNLDYYKREYDRAKHNLERCAEKVNQFQQQLNVYNSYESTGVLSDTLQNYTNITPLFASSQNIQFKIKQYITTFDSDIYEQYKANKSCYLNQSEYIHNGYLVSDVLYVFDCLFITQTVRLTTEAHIKITHNGVRGECTSRMGVLPHPHIACYNCFGSQYDALLCDSASQGNYAGLIDIINAAMSNFNITDSVVGENFISMLTRNNKLLTFESVATGELLSFDDIVKQRVGG